MKRQDFKKLKIPDKPGVYFFMKGRKIIYIGKATSLKSRVKSYFRGDLINTRGPLLVDMVFKAENIKWTLTDSVLEALILEANLIKKHQPYYNTREKDDKSFNYVCITKDKKVAVVRGKVLDVKKYKSIFGPFTNGGQLREALKIIRKFFPYIEDRKGTKGKEEFYKQIKLFPADSDENKKNIKNIKLFFEGKKKSVILNLKKEMNSLAKSQKFEEAEKVKRQIFALGHINDISLIKKENLSKFSVSKSRIEAYDIAHMSGKNMVGVMTVMEDGEIEKREYKKFSARGGSAFGGKTVLGDSKANDTGALAEVLQRRLKHTEWKFPTLIVVDGGKAQINTANKVLKSLNIKIPVVSVLKDEKHKPKDILGNKSIIQKYKRDILLVNNEAHRFAIKYHKSMRSKNFLK